MSAAVTIAVSATGWCALCTLEGHAALKSGTKCVDPREARYFVRTRGPIEVKTCDDFTGGGVCTSHAERLDESNGIAFIVRL